MKKLPDITTQFPEWYQEVITNAELAENAPVRGCIVIRPYGWAIWENIKSYLDERIKATGHQNASFPLLIPMSFFEKEAEHVEGFAPELAVVTHAGGKELEEPYAIRPTSETMFYAMFAKWITSWRDLPLKLNQWANVMRWEKRTRPFLRTTEFFWQEGHTAHETAQEAEDEARMMMNEYVKLAQDLLAIPVVMGKKSESEKFAGADTTLTFEALMQDGKALQMGTSHLISRSFGKAFNINYQNRDGELDTPYLTSWGVTTRLIGAVIMTHGDQKGLMLPPRIAPIQVIVVPILKKDASARTIMDFAERIAHSFNGKPVRVEIDRDEQSTPGAKFYKWEQKGVPLRIEVGPRDVQNNEAVVVDRLTGTKQTVTLDDIASTVQLKLDELHTQMLERAQEKRDAQWHHGDKLNEFGKALEKDGGFYQTGWCGAAACESLLKEYKATTRCLLDKKEHAVCFGCDKESGSDVLVAKSY